MTEDVKNRNAPVIVHRGKTLHSAAEAARITNLSVHHLRHLARTKQLPGSYKITARKWYFDLPVVEAHLFKGANESADGQNSDGHDFSAIEDL